MKRSTHLRSLAKSGWRNDRASQLVEFAVALPLLVVFVVGIFDFSSAFTLKQKLTNITRDAARAAAAGPANDVQSPSNPVPMSINAAFEVVDNYFGANRINDCGLSGSTPTPTGLTWTYKGTTGCPPGGLTLIINRGYYFPSTGAALPTVACAPQNPGGQTAVIATCVSIQYAYPWRFGRAASLLGATILLPSTITTAAVAMNEN